MGYLDIEPPLAGQHFLDEYRDKVQGTRQIFDDILNTQK
jgi:pentose-5-phosphate-3-epimerase